MAQQDFLEEGVLEILADSMTLDGRRLEELLLKHLYMTQTGKHISLGRARVSIEWLEEG